MIPKRLKAQLKSGGHSGYINHMRGVRASVHNSNNLLRHVVVRSFDEPGSVEARAVDKVLRLP